MKTLILNLVRPELFKSEPFFFKKLAYYYFLAMALVGFLTCMFGLYQMFFGTTTGNNIPLI